MDDPDSLESNADEMLRLLLDHPDSIQVPILSREVARSAPDLLIAMIESLAPNGPISRIPHREWRSNVWVVFRGLLTAGAEAGLVDLIPVLERYRATGESNQAVDEAWERLWSDRS